MLSAYLSRLTHHLYKQQCYCETVPRKDSSRACCQNEVSEHYSFLSFPSFSLASLHSLSQLYVVLLGHKRNRATRSSSRRLYPNTLASTRRRWVFSKGDFFFLLVLTLCTHLNGVLGHHKWSFWTSWHQDSSCSSEAKWQTLQNSLSFYCDSSIYNI